MRSKLRAVPLAALGALLFAAPAVAGNGGLAPVAPQSSNAEDIRSTYWLILAITGAIFVLVEATLILFIVRYRRRRRAWDAEGPQVRGHTRLEVAWTVVPVLILAAIAGYVLSQLPGIANVPVARAGERVDVSVEGHQFYWLFRYPGGQISIDRMVVPVGRVISLEVTSPDVIHSWWIPALGGKIDAIPGRTNHTWFRATRVGTYRGQCAELCGFLHADMLARVEVVSLQQYRRFLASHAPASASTVGKETFEGVCAKCHGFAGEGKIGPPIAGGTFDQATVDLIRNGGIRMPAVGTDWTDAQMKATIDYLNKAIGSGR